MKVTIEKIKKRLHSDTPGRQRVTRSVASVYLLRRTGAFLCIFVAQLFCTAALYAQQEPADDRSSVRVRYPQPDRLRDLQTDRAYQYGRDAPPPENPVAKFFEWLYRKVMDFLSSEAYQNVWQYVFLAAIAGFVIYLLMKAEVLGFLFSRKAQSAGLDYENLTENIHEIDFDAAIDDAVGQRNFRLAVRLLYLQTLKRLTDANLITYKPDKTNRQYVYELAGSPVQSEFEGLTRQFEFVWYGDFPVDEARFGQIRPQFQQFNKRQSVET